MRFKTLMLFIILTPSAFGGTPDFDADCAALAKQHKVDAAELSEFKTWCARFEAQCYKIEDSAAEACGAGGGLEAQAQGLLNEAGAAVKLSEASYRTNGAIAGQNCEAVKNIRQEQRSRCNRDQAACVEKKASFPSATSNHVLKCYSFGPESSQWSARAKSRISLCQAITSDLTQVELEAKTEGEQCGTIGDIVTKASGQGATTTNDPGREPPTRDPYKSSPYTGGLGGGSAAPTKMNHPDPKACGIFGCMKNEDGTYTPVRR